MNKGNIHLSLLTIISLVLLFSIIPFSPVSGDDTLIVGGDNDYPPFAVDKNGKVSGFSIDIIQLILENSGYSVSYNLTEWEKCPLLLYDGKIDLISAIYYTPERDSLYEFSSPYYHTVLSCYILKNSAITSLDQALTSSVIVGKESLTETIVENMGTAFQLVRVESEVEGLKLLSSGHYDCAVTVQELGRKIIEVESLDNIIEIGTLPDSYELCFAAKKGNRELIGTINHGLQEIRLSGEYDTLYNKWFEKKDFVSPEQVKLFRMIGIYILVVIVIIIAWVMSLRREVKRKTQELEYELSERLRAEEALRESEQLTSAFMDNLPLIVLIKDKNSKVLYYNKYLSAIRKNEETLIGKTPEEYINDPQMLTRVMKEDKRVIKEGFLYSKEQYLSFNEDSPRYYDVTKFATGEDKNNLLIGALYIDVTERKLVNDELVSYRNNLERMVEQRTIQLINNKNNLEAEIDTRKKTEKLLRESEELFRSIFNYTAVGICLMDINANFQKVNDAICEITGYAREEFLGSHATKFILDEDWEFVRSKTRQLLNHEIQDYRDEVRIKRKDGEIRTLDVWTKILHDSKHNANAIIASLHDITDVKKGIEAMMEAEQLKTATQLAGAVAHEFNNPLAIIQVTTELIEPMCDDDKGKELMSKIPKQIKRMQELVNTLKDLKSVRSKDYAGGVKILDLHEKKDHN